MNNLRAMWEFMGKPTINGLELLIRNAQKMYFDSKEKDDERGMSTALENFDLGCDIQAYRDEQEQVTEALALVRGHQKQLKELKGLLNGPEQVRIRRTPKHSETFYETVNPSGVALESTPSTDAWEYKKTLDISDLLVKVGAGDKNALKQVEQRAVQFTRRKKRLERIRALVADIARGVQVGTELVVRQGDADLTADVKQTRAEYRYRKQAIRRGAETKINDDGTLVMNGHRVSTFMLRATK